MLAWLPMVVGCTPVDFVGQPTLEPTEGALLTTWLTARTGGPAELDIEIDDGRDVRRFRSEPAHDHRVLIGGLRPSHDHSIRVVARGVDGGRSERVRLEHTSEALPPNLPRIQVVESQPDRMEPGLTLVGLGSFLTMVDAEGVVRWAFERPMVLHELNLSSRGHVIYQNSKESLVELALSGEFLAEWRREGPVRELPQRFVLDVPAIHHDAVELPNGNWLALSVERRLVEGFPTSETDPDAPTQEAWVAGVEVIEFTRQGQLVNRWSMLDLLDPTRISYGSVGSAYWQSYWDEPTRDWSHGNAVWYDEVRDEVLVSLRHQDAVVALDYDSGALSWIFAPDANWPDALRDYVLLPARPELQPVYHQHSAKIGPGGELVLFDNGNQRASAFEPGLDRQESWSRAVVATLDHEAGTWDLAFEYGEGIEPRLYSGSLSDADLLPQTGNLLVTFGNLEEPGLPGAIVREVTTTGAGAPEVVFEFGVPSPLTVYRSQRVEGVFPGL